MVCEHKRYGEKPWHPFEYLGRHRGLKAHPVCSECGLVKNVSSDRPQPRGHCFNVLGQLAEYYSISLVQIKLTSRELMCLEDSYGFCRHLQEEVFKEIVQKYTIVPERSIKNAL